MPEIWFAYSWGFSFFVIVSVVSPVSNVCITPRLRFPRVAVCATISAPKSAPNGLPPSCDARTDGAARAVCIAWRRVTVSSRIHIARKEAAMDGHASFGYWVRRQRKALDLTQAELARRVGCAEGTIRMIEADARRPSRQIAARLAEQLAIAPPDRAAFLQSARAEGSADRLAPPVQHASHVPSPIAPTRPGGTVTFLFTDIEGSTQLWEHEPQAMTAALARHDAILRQQIATHGGVIVKTT